VVGGKVRKYYTITDKGRDVLADARTKIAELVGEVVEGRGPRALPDPDEGSEEQERSASRLVRPMNAGAGDRDPGPKRHAGRDQCRLPRCSDRRAEVVLLGIGS
jgi:hypothetical protein